MPALQPPLKLTDRRRCVLATVEDARRHLRDWEATEDSIDTLIDQNYLLAWDIALHGQSGSDPDKLRKDKSPRARELRILPESITHFDMFGGRRKFEWSEEKIFKRLFEGLVGTSSTSSVEIITSADLRLLFNCGPTHITNLIDARQLNQVPGTAYTTGPKGAAKIYLRELRRFLQTRFEGAL